MVQKENSELKKVNFKDSIVAKVTLVNMVIFLCAALFSVAVILLVNLIHHYRKDTQVMEVYLSNTSSSLDDVLKDMGRVSLICFSDTRTQQILKSYDEYAYKERLENTQYLQQLYTSLITIRNDIEGIYMFDTDDLIFYQDNSQPSIRKDSSVQAFLESIIELEDTTVNISGCYLLFDELPDFMRYSSFATKDIEQRYSLYLVRPVRTFKPYEIIGYIAIRTSVQNVQGIMEQYLEPGVSYTLLYDEGNVVCSQNKELIGADFQETELYSKLKSSKGYFLSSYEGELCLISYEVSEYSGLTLITAKPFISIIMEMQNLLKYCSIVFSVFSFISLVCIWRITKKSLRRITDFAQSLGSFEPTNLNQRYEIEKKDEIGQLKISFNYMMDIINELVVSEYEGQVKLQQAELTEQRLSMLYLKSQVNPHFLYNTLDMIRIKAELNKDKEVSNMLMQLVAFYRLSTKVDSSWVTIKHEVELLDAYMKLMCYRYPGLDYQTEIQKSLLDLRIPNFILQPLVENSLMHGLKNRGYTGTVELKIFNTGGNDDELQIQIMDNGFGMSEEMLKQLNAELKPVDGEQSQEEAESKHIGIANVRSRLQFFYGNDVRMEFCNRTNGGLCITIKIEGILREKDTMLNMGQLYEKNKS